MNAPFRILAREAEYPLPEHTDQGTLVAGSRPGEFEVRAEHLVVVVVRRVTAGGLVPDEPAPVDPARNPLGVVVRAPEDHFRAVAELGEEVTRVIQLFVA